MNRLFLMLMCMTMCLVSCHDDDDVWNPKDANFWGYFDGEINGEKVHLQNSLHKYYIEKGLWCTVNNKFAHYILFNELDKNVSFRCNLMEFEVGTQCIAVSPPPLAEIDDYNSFSGCTSDSINHLSQYKVKASRPAKVEITRIEYFHDENGKPYTLQPRLIAGNVDAVLYHGTDSISIKGHFATK